jgi:hypothetical protein
LLFGTQNISDFFILRSRFLRLYPILVGFAYILY